MTGFEKVDQATIEAKIEGAEKVIVVDFTATWCPPCRILSPILKRVATEFEDRLEVVELDTDENPAAASRYGIRGMPTLVFFHRGKEIGRSIGVAPEHVMRERIGTMVEASGVR